MWSSDSDSEEEVHFPQRRARTFKDRINFAFATDFEFNERFRLSAAKMEMLVNIVGHFLRHATNRNHALSPAEQLQIAFHWFGTGSQYHSAGDMHDVSKATVCRCVKNVTNCINRILLPQVVCWPVAAEDILQIVRNFNRLGGLPSVVGAVDGILFNIDGPGVDEAAFVDRHGMHSINVMAVCGPKLNFFYVNANWPGSVHDARVLRNSILYNRMEEGWRPIQGGYLIGDSAYPLKEWLITPLVRNPNDPAEIRFIRAHKQTRRVIEQAFGILKQKFPCLNHLRVKPAFAARVVTCCVALCNFARNANEEDRIIAADEEPNGNHADFVERDLEENEVFPLPQAAENRLRNVINHFR